MNTMNKRLELPIQKQVLPEKPQGELLVSYDKKENTFLVRAVTKFLQDMQHMVQNHVVHMVVTVKKMKTSPALLKQACSHLIAQILHAHPLITPAPQVVYTESKPS